ncbi:MAG: Dickkopf N-terminal cysteine-rich domain-containing protein [Sandaracinaceae bacterium]
MDTRLLLLVALTAAGCTTSHGDTDGGADAAAPFAGYREHTDTLRRITCEHFLDCCSPAELDVRGWVDIDDCLLSLDGGSTLADLVVADLTAGRATFDPATALACQGAYRGQSCDDFNTLGLFAPGVAVCDEVVVGLAGVGAICESPLACEDGTYCDSETFLSRGVCAARLPADAACAAGDVCADGQVCLREASGDAYRCQAARAVGEPCSEALDCATLVCSGLGECAPQPPQCGS